MSPSTFIELDTAAEPGLPVIDPARRAERCANVAAVTSPRSTRSPSSGGATESR